MAGYPIWFKADLRDPLPCLELEGEWSAWTRRALIEESCADTAGFMLEALPRLGRVLEVGCGNGYLALELARLGHDVTAIDPSQEAIAVAERSRLGAGVVALKYVASGFASFLDSEPYDAVIFNRSLHHIPDLAQTLKRARDFLAPGGTLVCQEYGYDRLDLPTARWAVRLRETLENDPTKAPLSPQEFWRDWHARGRAEGLHGFHPMLEALRERFTESYCSFEPYLFVWIAQRLGELPLEKERAAVQRLKRWERERIQEEAAPALAFRFIGRV